MRGEVKKKKKRERLDRWSGQTEQFARESEKKLSKDQWRNRLTPRWGAVRFSERRTCTPAARPEWPHAPAVPVPERLLTLKPLYCLRHKHYAYRQRERKATVNYKRKKMAVKLSHQERQMIETQQSVILFKRGYKKTVSQREAERE